jgi:hypothetical protein
MDPKELRGLMEAYSEVYAPQQIDELSNRKLRAYIKKSGKSHAEINKKWDQGTATDKEKSKSIGHEIGQHRAFKTLDKRARKEDFEFWVDSLMEEGYDLSDYTWDEMLDIYLDEAEGSYGATPKAYSAARGTKMTAKRKPFLKKMLSRTNPANRTSAYDSPRKGLTADDRERARAGSAYGVGTRQDHDYPSQGPGGVTKNPKKLRKQKAMGEIGESYDIFDVVLEFLQVEGYAETLEEAEWMMANVIDEEVIDTIIGEAITSEKGKAKAAEMIAKRTHASGRAKAGQGDNVALIKHIGRSNRDGLGGTPPNRKVAGSNWPKSYSGIGGTGNKAARRAGTYQEDFEFWVNELVEEGYDLSEYTWDEMYDIYEGEGSYGKTPKASDAYSALVRKRTNKPASEYSKKGEKTKKVKSAEKHMWRSLRGGPHHGRGKMDADERTERRAERAFDLETTYGSGSVTKNPKKLRKQRAMGEID